MNTRNRVRRGVAAMTADVGGDNDENIAVNSSEPTTGYGTLASEPLQCSNPYRRGPTFSGQSKQLKAWMELWEAHTNDVGIASVLDQDSPDGEMNKKYYFELIKCLPCEIIDIVSSNAKYDGKLAYKLLLEHYLGDIPGRKKVAYQQMLSIKWQSNDNYQSYLARTDILRAEMLSLNIMHDEQQLCINTINGLPSKYDNIKSFLIGNDNLTSYITLKQCIISQIIRNQTLDTNSTPQVMAVRQANYYPQYNYQRFRRNYPNHNRGCSTCGRTNHRDEDCYHRLKTSNAGSTPGRRGQAFGRRRPGRGHYHRGNSYPARGNSSSSTRGGGRSVRGGRLAARARGGGRNPQYHNRGAAATRGTYNAPGDHQEPYDSDYQASNQYA